METNDIRAFLGGERSAIDTLSFLTDEFMPAVISVLNEPATRRRMALYGGDRVPENERNLTDVRNRMSLLIEYKLAWISNQILEAAEINDLFWTNVVANRFPDLELRDNAGRRGIRVEVKCIQAIAEEKAANFDTLKKDLNPSTDYVVVFLWEWFRDAAAIGWDRAPKMLKAFVFHASSLAELRDYNWLNKPPPGVAGGYQGFDLRFAVNCRAGIYNEEEGNYGKLLRIWNPEANYEPGLTDLLNATIQTYSEFADYTVWSGFEVLAKYLLTTQAQQLPNPLAIHGEVVGFRNGSRAILFKRRVGTAQQLRELAVANQVEELIVMTDKYQWSESKLVNGQLVRQGEGRKPKHLARRLLEN